MPCSLLHNTVQLDKSTSATVTTQASLATASETSDSQKLIICASPAPTAVTVPSLATVATLSSLLFHDVAMPLGSTLTPNLKVAVGMSFRVFYPPSSIAATTKSLVKIFIIISF